MPPPPDVAVVPPISNSPDPYSEAHPDRVTEFKAPMENFIFNPRIESPGEWRHELDHDAESVFWLLFYWAMVVAA